MSDERKSPTPPPTWGEEAHGLASRFAIASGVVITFVLFGLIVVPALLRERRPPKAAPSDQPAAASLGWLDQAESPPSKGKDLPPVDPATVMTANPKLLARGEVLFKQNCTSCHGDAGRGDGPAVATLNPKPRNFSQPDKWTRGFRATDIFTTLTVGVKGTGMAAFDFIVPADRMALVHYVRSLGAFDHGSEDAKASEELAQQFRSKGVHIPNRIPVSLAIRKMVQEQASVPALNLPAVDDQSPTAELLRAVIADPARVARTVAATQSHADVLAVARAWVAGVPGNGFAPALASMNDIEWQEIRRALLGVEDEAPALSREKAKEP
jgi:mono/diheme cytochrome c family protein